MREIEKLFDQQNMMSSVGGRRLMEHHCTRARLPVHVLTSTIYHPPIRTESRQNVASQAARSD